MRSWRGGRLEPTVRSKWKDVEFDLRVRTAGVGQWKELLASGLPVVTDGGFTEVAPGSATVVADHPALRASSVTPETGVKRDGERSQLISFFLAKNAASRAISSTYGAIGSIRCPRRRFAWGEGQRHGRAAHDRTGPVGAGAAAGGWLHLAPGDRVPAGGRVPPGRDDPARPAAGRANPTADRPRRATRPRPPAEPGRPSSRSASRTSCGPPARSTCLSGWRPATGPRSWPATRAPPPTSTWPRPAAPPGPSGPARRPMPARSGSSTGCAAPSAAGRSCSTG